VHKAFAVVSEEGTEAAAATGVIVGTTSVPDREAFHADHPFLFLIQDNRTESILFLGRVVRPDAFEADATISAGDFDGDGDVDGDDFLVWQSSVGMSAGAMASDGDADGDGDVDGDDFLIWQSNFGSASGSSATSAVPEPSGLATILISLVFSAIRRRKPSFY
jgi:hypothetical protein